MFEMQAKLTKQLIDGLKHGERMYKVWDTEISGFFIRVAPAPSKRKTFAIFYRTMGRARDFNLGLYGALTVDQARTEAKKKLGEVAAGTDVQATKKADRAATKAAKHQTLGGFIEHRYQAWAEAHLRGHKEQLRMLSVDFADMRRLPLSEISQWTIQKWAAGKRNPTEPGKKPLRGSSINRRITALKSVLTKAVEWGVIDQSPLRGMKRIKTDDAAKPRYLSADEAARLKVELNARQARQRQARDQYNAWRAARHLDPLPVLSCAFTDHMKPLVLLALNTGMRRGELFNLAWKDVDLAGRLVTVEGGGSKSGRTRHIPLNDEAHTTLTTWREQAPTDLPLVFPSPVTGGRLDNINSAWREILKKAKIQDFRFHDLRHTFASWLVMRGVDLTTVRELLGHADLETTLRYAHLAPEHKAAAVAVLDQT